MLVFFVWSSGLVAWMLEGVECSEFWRYKVYFDLPGRVRFGNSGYQRFLDSMACYNPCVKFENNLPGLDTPPA
jgi:hypothetical protein